ncbi:hypothetical protein RchiOBHm_Chr1g0383131 [Rosa chinensis]|uniref:Uncharacterized protein n=1 Tax=Rosa chinensis TaxID=74649 RepID=A0A2P6SPJ8_ROSCH|nr:hypothetical protein RchiOBHm_Chr1g0383131 [Rosa chinensis]
MTTTPVSLRPPSEKELYIRTKNGKIYYPQASVRIKILDPKCAWYCFCKLSELTQLRRYQTGQNMYTA